jgi:mannose-6-phosphate isomerase-like protein (cupin superfamily)
VIRILSAAAALVLCSCSVPPTPEVVIPDIAERSKQLDDDNARFAASSLIDGQGAVSGRLIRVREPIKPHVHWHSDELVYILEGSGVFTVGDRRVEVSRGTFLCVPRGTPHSFAPGADGALAISLYTPAFRDGDRVPVSDR